MKRTLYHVISLILALTLVISALPATAFAEDYACIDYESCTADGGKIYIISKDNCPIRKAPNNKGEIVARGTEGELVSVKKVFWTAKLTRWCEINVGGEDEKLYIHIDNVEPHDSHTFFPVYDNENGYINYCGICGCIEVGAQGDKGTCDLTCIADQAVKGSLSEYDPTVVSLITTVILGELPFVGSGTDIRDLVADVLSGQEGYIIFLDVIALLPLFGIIRHADRISNISKHSDDIGSVGKYGDEASVIIRELLEEPNSKKLGKNMDDMYALTGKERYNNFKDYMLPGAVVAAHHIVPGKAKGAQDARNILIGLGIGINSAENGVYLPRLVDSVAPGALHAGSHSAEYYSTVNQRITERFLNAPRSPEAKREAVIDELDKIAEDLRTGKLSL